jgi:thioester reductase-like protein
MDTDRNDIKFTNRKHNTVEICDAENKINKSSRSSVTYNEETDALIASDEILHPMIQPSIGKDNSSSCNSIFLTGSSGFLGAYLIDELLKQTDTTIIYCLIRKTSKFIKNQALESSRVINLIGDLSQPKFGFDDNQYAWLSTKICSIYHCGAHPHLFRTYNDLRLPNVFGSIEIIKLACLANAQINYISTASVEDPNDRTGYTRSKRVAEKLMEQARRRGLHVNIFRPGLP